MLFRTLTRLNQENYFLGLEKSFDAKADIKRRTQSRKFYEYAIRTCREKIPKPFNMKDEADYQEQMQQLRKLRRLRNKTEEVEYFSWKRNQLLFKNQNIPEEPRIGKRRQCAT